VTVVPAGPGAGPRWLAAAALAGGASVAGFGDWNLFPLPLFALGLLFFAWTRTSAPRAAAGLGLAYGAGLFLVGVSWVYVSLHDFGMMPAPLAATATLLFCLYLALFPAAVGYLQARIPVALPLRLMLVMPALWTLAEWVRSWLFTGFPWLALGYSQADGPLAGFGPILGVLGVSLLAAVAAGHWRRSPKRRAQAQAVAAGVLVVLGASGWALRSVAWTAPVGEPLAVSLVQGNIPQELKFVDGRYESTLETYARLVEGSTGRLIILPEIAIPRFLHEVDPDYVARLKGVAAARDGDLLLGVPVLEAERRYYNAVVSLGTSPTQGYAKSHLVPFGEFVPPGFGWIVAVLTIPLSDFARGSEGQRPLQLAGQRVALNICYEDAFGPEIIRQLPEATLLVNVSNVAWFGDSLAPAQHLRIARMRSLETGRYMLRATNTGVTAIVDPRGAVAGRLPSFTEGVLEGSVRGYAGATPYIRLGNAPVLVGAALMAAVALGLTRRGARKPSGAGNLRPPA
jgi:apolipoprotein N-acyltransferase